MTPSTHMMMHPQSQMMKRQISKRKTTTIPTTTPTTSTTTATATATLPCLPHDIIFFHLLPKLPVRCLFRFNCVSKLWYNTIHHPNFHASHLTHAKSNPSLVAILRSRTTLICFLHLDEGGRLHHHHHHHHHHPTSNNNNNIASLELKSGASNVVGICNGITCNILPSDIQISNPSTRELLNFPKPKPSTEMQRNAGMRKGFGFDPLMNEYKVIHIWLDYRKYCECMVYTLGTNKWRNITATCNHQPSCYPIDLAPICISGVLFWRTNMYNRILSFDLHHEKFQVIICPQVPLGSICHTLFELEGRPCLVYRRDDNLKDEIQLTLYTLKELHHLQLTHTKQHQQASRSSSGARWIRLRAYIRLPLKADIKLIRFVEFAKHIYLHWVTMDGHFILYDINRKRLIHNKLLDLNTRQWVLLVNHVENLLSLKTFVPSSTGEVEVKYVSSREEAKHESPDHQQWEMQKKKCMKLVFDALGLERANDAGCFKLIHNIPGGWIEDVTDLLLETRERQDDTQSKWFTNQD